MAAAAAAAVDSVVVKDESLTPPVSPALVITSTVPLYARG